MTGILPGLLLAVCCVVGLVLVALGLPGLWVMVLGVIGYAWMTGFHTIGAVVGVPVPVIGSVIGAFVGSFAGAALFEYTRQLSPGVALRAGWGALLGRAAASALKIALGLAIAVVAAFEAIRG